ncbi:MAG: hypothetical protein SWE60_04320 [Thermodesulfobacteriota bacterium]|nr:hypothetical protein [Thermodesulfobacteriota bacterium]
MKYTSVVKTAFSICTFLSLLIGVLLLLNARGIEKYARMIDTGKQMLETVLTMELYEKRYLLHEDERALDEVKEKIRTLRKFVSTYEKSDINSGTTGFFEFALWEEAINLYERLFDQFVLYHRAIEKNIAEIRNLENRILAVIFSKMNPERGIIALQEIRIHEKGYLIYRDTGPPDEAEKPFEDKRKEAVSHLLMWAQNDQRIQELIGEDNQLFDQIVANYEGQDHTLLLLEKERSRIRDMADSFSAEGNQGLQMSHRRSSFLVVVLLLMWVIVGCAIVVTRAN